MDLTYLLLLQLTTLQLQTRLSMRPAHHLHFRHLHQAGHVIWGGPLFSAVPEQPMTATATASAPQSRAGTGIGADAAKSFIGSTVIVKAECVEAAIAQLSEDDYVKHAVWDLEAAGIWEVEGLV